MQILSGLRNRLQKVLKYNHRKETMTPTSFASSDSSEYFCACYVTKATWPQHQRASGSRSCVFKGRQARHLPRAPLEVFRW